MKKSILLVGLLLIAFSCTKESSTEVQKPEVVEKPNEDPKEEPDEQSTPDDPETETPTESTAIVASIVLETNTKLIIADNASNAELEAIILDDKNEVLNGLEPQVLVNGENYVGAEFMTSTPGDYEIVLKIGEIESNSIDIRARENILNEEISIPVIFHVVHFGEQIGGASNLSISDVQQLLDKLNSGFSNGLGSTNPNAVDMLVRFRLATRDKENVLLPEPGINRINAISFDDGSPEFADSVDLPNDQKLGPNESYSLGGNTFWNPREYLNIWIYPDQFANNVAILPRVSESNTLDGLETVPDNCECSPNKEFFQSCKLDTNSALNSKVIVHEVGHVFGLKHTFSSDNCLTSDYCEDTYSYNFENIEQDCPDNKGQAEYDNFMDYNGVINTFTYDQRTRVHHVLQYGLWLNELKDSNK